MWAILPLIGPLMSSVATWLVSRNELKQSTDTNDIAEIKARLESQRKDIRLQLQQDMIVFPVAAWVMLYVWDQIIAKMYPDLVWVVLPLDQYPIMGMLPFAVMAYLFGLPIRDKFTK